MKKIRLLLLCFITAAYLTGCVSLPDEALIAEANGLSEPCKKLFLATPADCRNDKSLCKSYNGVPNVYSYQEAAQGSQYAAFSVIENEKNEVVSCVWNAAGYLRGWSYVENAVLSSCERHRMGLIDRDGAALKPCRIFARNNDVQ